MALLLKKREKLISSYFKFQPVIYTEFHSQRVHFLLLLL